MPIAVAVHVLLFLFVLYAMNMRSVRSDCFWVFSANNSQCVVMIGEDVCSLPQLVFFLSVFAAFAMNPLALAVTYFV